MLRGGRGGGSRPDDSSCISNRSLPRCGDADQLICSEDCCCCVDGLVLLLASPGSPTPLDKQASLQLCNVGLFLAHHLRRWSNIVLTLGYL